MKSFLDQVREDFRAVFLNPEEFGRECDWNGTKLRITESAAPPLIESPGPTGILQEVKQIICLPEDLPEMPTTNSRVRLDGVVWNVLDVSPPFAHIVITLGRLSS